MKNNKSRFSILVIFCFFLFFGFKGFAQDDEVQPALPPNDEELQKMEEEARKFGSPDMPDPYYEKHIKDAYEKEQDKKAEEYIKQLKEEYGAEKFDLQTLEKGPVKKEEEKKWPDLYPTPPSDSYYEEDVKTQWGKKDKEIKQEIIDLMKSELGDEKTKKKATGTGEAPSYGSDPSDPYYEKEIKESWNKDKKDILERVKKKLEKDKLIIKEDDKDKKKDKEKEK